MEVKVSTFLTLLFDVIEQIDGIIIKCKIIDCQHNTCNREHEVIDSQENNDKNHLIMIEHL